MGAAFVYAAYVKLSEPWQLFAANIAAYEVVPMWAAKLLARSLPWCEGALGLLVMSGKFSRTAGVVMSAMLVGFIGLMLQAKLAGKDINCGCFSSNEPISWHTFLRDGSMLAVALFLTVMAFRMRRGTAAATDTQSV
jgi:hypothetical protein